MSKKVFNKNISKSCDHCFFGRKNSAFEMILCEYKGPVSAENFCFRYKYDPLKRTPENSITIPRFSKSDFEL